MVAVYLGGTGEGLPYYHHWDEVFVTQRPQQALRDRTPFFDSFEYPQLYSYLVVPAYVLAYALARHEGVIAGADDVRVGHFRDEQRIHPPGLYRAMRAFDAVLGLLTLLALWRLARELFEPRVADLAVVFAGLSLGPLVCAWYVTVDTPACLFAVCALVPLARIHRGASRPRDFVLLGVWCALAASTKYNYAMLLPTVAVVLAGTGRRAPGREALRSGFGWFCGSFLAAFLLANPGLFVSFEAVVSSALKEGRDYRGMDREGKLGIFFGNGLRAARYLVASNGLAACLLAVAGVASMVKPRRRHAVGFLLLFPCLMSLYMCTMFGKYFHRNFLAVAVLLNVLSAVGFWFLLDGLMGSARGRARRTLRVAFVALVGIGTGAQALRVAELGYAAAFCRETRSRALDLLAQTAPDSRVWVEERIVFNTLGRSGDAVARLDLRRFASGTLDPSRLASGDLVVAPLDARSDLSDPASRWQSVATIEMCRPFRKHRDLIASLLGVPGPRAYVHDPERQDFPIYAHNPTLFVYRVP